MLMPQGGTGIVEALNYSLPQRYGVLVRKSCTFNKFLPLHPARIKICSDQHNQKLNHNQKFNSLKVREIAINRPTSG